MGERTLVILKPDCIKRNLVNKVINMLNSTGAKLVFMKSQPISKEQAEELYQHLKELKNYNDIIEYIQGKTYGIKDLIFLIYEGENVIKKIKNVVGTTNPKEASPQTIRGKYGRINPKNNIMENTVHCTTSKKDYEREMRIFFSGNEIIKLLDNQ